MKAITYIRRIQKKGTITLEEVENLNTKMHDEKLLSNYITIRFRPLFADFDLIDTQEKRAILIIGNIDKLVEFIKECRKEPFII